MYQHLSLYKLKQRRYTMNMRCIIESEILCKNHKRWKVSSIKIIINSSSFVVEISRFDGWRLNIRSFSG